MFILEPSHLIIDFNEYLRDKFSGNEAVQKTVAEQLETVKLYFQEGIQPVDMEAMSKFMKQIKATNKWKSRYISPVVEH